MFYDEIEQGVLDAFRADDMPRARTGMAQLLAEELKELVPATEAAAKTREHFDGKLNHETDTVFLQFITSRAEAEKAVFELAVVSGDLLSLLEYAQSEKIDKNLAPREVIRLAVLAADFLKWLYQPSGQQRLLHLSGYAKRKSYWTVELEPEEAASEAMIKLLGTLPSSESYMYRAICSRYLDAARKRGLELQFQVSIDDDLDDAGGTMPGSIENKTSQRIPNASCFSKIRKETLFRLLGSVAKQIPEMKIKMPGKSNFITLGKRHQQVFEMWLSLEPAVRTNAEMTIQEMCRAIGCTDKTLNEDFRRLQIALSQRDEYPRILELMMPIRFRGEVPPDYRERFEKFIQNERAAFQELVRSWRSELFTTEANHFDQVTWSDLRNNRKSEEDK